MCRESGYDLSSSLSTRGILRSIRTLAFHSARLPGGLKQTTELAHIQGICTEREGGVPCNLSWGHTNEIIVELVPVFAFCVEHLWYRG